MECDPSWHWILRTAVEREVPSLAWRDRRPGSHIVRLAMAYLWAQLGTGPMCPMIMTFSAVPARRIDDGVRRLAETIKAAMKRPRASSGDRAAVPVV